MPGPDREGYKLPEVKLSAPERMWLGYVYSDFRRGMITDVERLKSHLLETGKWPRGFRPYDIDARLLLDANKITLLGIWHVDSETDLIRKCDQVLGHIRGRILASPRANEIRVADISEATGIHRHEVSMIIHLSSQLGFFWKRATSEPRRHGDAWAPGQYERYASIEVGDPEVHDQYESYQGIEHLVREFFEEGGEQAEDGALDRATRLYDRVLALAPDGKDLSADEASLVIELADDAIKEFGNSEQEKKVELRKIKAAAERVLPPGTIEELRKRAEGQLLERAYPKTRPWRSALTMIFLLASALGAGLWVYNALKGATADERGAASVPSPNQPEPERRTDAATKEDKQISDLERQASLKQPKDDVSKLTVESVISQVMGDDASVVVYTSGYGAIADKNVEVRLNGRDVSKFIKGQSDHPNGSVVTVMGRTEELNLNIGDNQVSLKIGAFETRPYAFKTFRAF